jgi:hypothetical protein
MAKTTEELTGEKGMAWDVSGKDFVHERYEKHKRREFWVFRAFRGQNWGRNLQAARKAGHLSAY